MLALSEAKKDKPLSLTISPADEDITHYRKKCRSAWARLIRKIYEVEPLVCPQCQHTMRIIAFIGSDAIIQWGCGRPDHTHRHPPGHMKRQSMRMNPHHLFTFKHLLLLHQKNNRRGLSTKRVKSLPNA